MEEVTALFGGKPGEPVPQVDPDDLKAVWEVQTSHPGERAIGISVLEQTCKPGADVKAVAYRAMNLGLLTLLFQQNLAPWLAPWIKADQRLDDAVFRIGAKIKMEWMEVGVPQNSVPFDINEFRRLLDENQTKYN
jgi:hypothetical protein